MNIAIDCRFCNFAGIGNYIKNIAEKIIEMERVNNNYILIFNEDIKNKDLYSKYENVKIVIMNSKPFTIKEQFEFYKIIKSYQIDKWFSPYLVVPLLVKVKVILTIHDLIPIVYHKFNKSALATAYFKIMFRFGVYKSQEIIAISKFTKNEILRVYGEKFQKKINVIYHGNNYKEYNLSLNLIEDILEKYRVDKMKYFIYVGSRKPWKNLTRMIEAFKLLNIEYPEINMVICGKRAKSNEVDIEKNIKQMELEKSILIYEELSDKELFTLMKNSIAIVCPSYYEGFGFTALEGMGAGTLVLTSKGTPMEEVINNAGMLFDPYNVEDIYKAMKNSIEDENLRKDIINYGYKRSQEFNWEISAKQHIKLLKK